MMTMNEHPELRVARLKKHQVEIINAISALQQLLHRQQKNQEKGCENTDRLIDFVKELKRAI